MVPVSQPKGTITVRVYSPEGPGPFPVHINMHGGMWPSVLWQHELFVTLTLMA